MEQNKVTATSNFQEMAWEQFFKSEIYDLMDDCSYEDDRVRIKYSVVNAADFISIRKVTDLSQDSMEQPLYIDIEIENKNTEADIHKITYNQVEIDVLPLITSSGIYIHGTMYGVVNENSLASCWYTTYNPMSESYHLHLRSKYGVTLSIDYKQGRFGVRLHPVNGMRTESLDLWTFLKGISGSESCADILNRLNRMDIFLKDYLRVQQIYNRDLPANAVYSEPTIEDCAAKVLHAYNKYVSTDIDCVSYLQRAIFIDNKLRFSPERKMRFQRMCGYGVALGLQLSRNVVFANGTKLKRGTALSAEDIVHLSNEGIPEIYVQHNGKSYKLFSITLEDNPTMKEIISAIYYFGLLIHGIGELTNLDDLSNKTTRTVSSRISEQIEKKLSQLTMKICNKYNSETTSGLVKLVTPTDIAGLKGSVREAIVSNPAVTMRDETNTLSSFGQTYKVASMAKGLGKSARAVMPSQYNRVCSFTTPESKTVGLNSSLTLGSQVIDGVIVYPVYRVVNGVRTDEVIMLDNAMEVNNVIAPYDANLDSTGSGCGDDIIPNCRLNNNIIEARRKDISFQDRSSLQSLSPPLLFVPSLNRDAGKRLTMAANAIAQARQTVRRERPNCSTGVEAVIHPAQTARDIIEIVMTETGLDPNLIPPDTKLYLVEVNDSFQDVQSSAAGYGTELVFNSTIPILDRFTYVINRLQPATNNSMKHQRVRYVNDGKYSLDDIVVYNNDTDDRTYKLSKDKLTFGKDIVSSDKLKDCGLAFGDNVKVLFKSWEGYGYEDSVIVNERFAKLYGLGTANIIRIKDTAVQETSQNGTVISAEVFTSEVGVNEIGNNLQYQHLDGNGLAKPGTVLKAGQVVIGKRCQVGKKIISRSTKTEVGKEGVVINSFLTQGTKTKYKSVTNANVIVASLVPLTKGDKVSGLHGNKGVIGCIVPDELMPFTEFGTPDIILNPLGVISRTNIGQLVEAVLGMIGHVTGEIQFLEPFSEEKIEDIIQKASHYGIEEVDVYDGRTGMKYSRKAFMGSMYFLRSSHTSTSKYNACGLGPVKRNDVSRQPIKSMGGGQRIGELLANAFRAHNATKTLEGFFTIQSDDVKGCKELIHNIEAQQPLKNIEPQSFSADLFLAHFRVLGINIVKNESENRYRPLTQKDIDILSLNKISLDMIGNSSRQTAGAMYLRDSKFLEQYVGVKSMEDLKREVYTSLELPQRVIMPLVCYGEHFLHMFVVQRKNNLTFLSCIMFKRILLQDWCLVDKDFNKFPIIISKKDAERDGLISEKTLFGVSALMRIFEHYDIRNTIAFIERLCIKNGVTGFEPYSAAKEVYIDPEAIQIEDDILSNIDKDEIDEDAVDSSIIDSAIKTGIDEIDSYQPNADFSDSADSFESESKESADSSEQLTEQLSDDSTIEVDEETENLEALEAVEDVSEEVQRSLLSMEHESEKFGDVQDITADRKFWNLLQIRSYTINFYETQDIQEYFVKDILVPPIAYRPEFEGRIASPIDKQLISLLGKLGAYCANPSERMLTQIYRELFWMVARSPRMKEKDKTIFESIVSHANKNSKVRDTLFAKRVLGSGRSVITVNPNLKIDEALVPFNILTTIFMTFLLSDRALYFPILNSYKKAKSKASEGKKFNSFVFNCLANNNILEFASYMHLDMDYIELQKVFTACQDELKSRLRHYLGIYPILLNREPSLHKLNVMGFVGDVSDGYAIELHPLACKPFNADFDGDQMAVFVSFLPESIAEIKSKMMQHCNLINPSNGSIIVELNQDMILGIYWMTMLQGNQPRIVDQWVKRIYVVDDAKESSKSALENLQDALDTGEIINNDIVSVVLQGKRVICYAEDALYFDPSDRYNDVVGGYPLIGGRLVPADAPIRMEFIDSVCGEEDNFRTINTYKGFRSQAVSEIWDDVDSGTISPQDYIILIVNGRRYQSTAGRILFNSVLPDAIGFTSNRQEDGSYALLYDCLITSKVIREVLDMLKEKFVQESNEALRLNSAESERDVFDKKNLKFCEVLDRLKDVGFYMADLSCVSISLYDFKQLELTRKNVSVRNVVLKRIDEVSGTKEEILQAIANIFTSMDSLLKTVTVYKTALPEIAVRTVRNESHLMAELNDSALSPFDYVNDFRQGNNDVVTIAQGLIRCALDKSDISFPLSILELTKILSNMESAVIKIRAGNLVRLLSDISSKLGLDYSKYVVGIDDMPIQSGISDLQHRLKIINKKYKEGRLTDNRRSDLILSVTEEYKHMLEGDIISTLDTLRNSNLFIMVDSGARGNISQLMEVCGIIGTVADGDGNSIPVPIENNLLNGLNQQELFTYSYHARTILVDTQLDIPVSGDMNRRMSYMTEYLKIRPETYPEEIFCGADSIDIPILWDAVTENIYRLRMLSREQLKAQGYVLDGIDDAWDTLVYRYYDVHNRYRIADLSVILRIAEKHGVQEVNIFRGNILDTIAVADLKGGMDLYIGCEDRNEEFIYDVRLNCCSTVDVVKVQELLSDVIVRNVVADINGIPTVVKIKYKMNATSKNIIYYRSIDEEKLSAEVYEVADSKCFEKRDMHGGDGVIARVIGNEFIKELEKQELYIDKLPIFTILNCKCGHTVCQKCFGLKYDTHMLPEPGELIGFQGVQSVCSVLSQMILDTHKSSGDAQGKIKDISALIDATYSLNTQLRNDISKLVSAIGKHRYGDFRSIINSEVRKSALSILIKDEDEGIKLFASQDIKNDANDKDVDSLIMRVLAITPYAGESMIGASFEEIVRYLSVVTSIITYRDKVAKVTDVLRNDESIDAKVIDELDEVALRLDTFFREIDYSKDSILGLCNEQREVFAKIDAILIDGITSDSDLRFKIEKSLDETSVGEETLKQFNTVLQSLLNDGVQFESIDGVLHCMLDSISRNNKAVSSGVGFMNISPELIAMYLKRENTDEELTAYMRMSVWFDLISLMRNSVLARNLELFPKAMMGSGVALQDAVVDGKRFNFGDTYSVEELQKAGIRFQAVKYSTRDSIGANHMIYADAFLGNTRRMLVKHMVLGDSDEGSSIGEAITGKDTFIEVKPYQFGVSTSTSIERLKNFEILDSDDSDVFAELNSKSSDLDDFFNNNDTVEVPEDIEVSENMLPFDIEKEGEESQIFINSHDTGDKDATSEDVGPSAELNLNSAEDYDQGEGGFESAVFEQKEHRLDNTEDDRIEFNFEEDSVFSFGSDEEMMND